MLGLLFKLVTIESKSEINEGETEGEASGGSGEGRGEENILDWESTAGHQKRESVIPLQTGAQPRLRRYYRDAALVLVGITKVPPVLDERIIRARGKAVATWPQKSKINAVQMA